MPTFSSIGTHRAIIERLQLQSPPQHQQQSPHNHNHAAPPKNPLALLGQTPHALQRHLGVPDTDMELVQKLRLQMAHAMLPHRNTNDDDDDDDPTTTTTNVVFSGLPTVRLDQALLHKDDNTGNRMVKVLPDVSLGDETLNDLVRFPNEWRTTTTPTTTTSIIPPGHLTCLQGTTGKTQLALQIAIEMTGGGGVVRYCGSSAGGASLLEIATRWRSMSEARQTGIHPHNQHLLLQLQPLSSLSELWWTLAAAEGGDSDSNFPALWIIDSLDTLCSHSHSHSSSMEHVLTKLRDWVRLHQIHMVVLLSSSSSEEKTATAATHTCCDVCLELSLSSRHEEDHPTTTTPTMMIMARVLHHVGRIIIEPSSPPQVVVALQLTRKGLIAVDGGGGGGSIVGSS